MPKLQKNASERDVLTVSQLNRRAKMLLETQLPLLWIEGEISNLSQPSSGHWYFTLKDAKAQVRCAMFKGRNGRVRFAPQQGQQVLLRGKVSLYEGRGDYQLIAEHMEEAGIGALQRAFEELKHKLEDEGLFASDNKKPLPTLPKRVALITSPTGAAVRDMVSVFERRYPLIDLVVLPVAVQGVDAPAQIARAINMACRMRNIEAIIVGRGGGSMEDLWAFNEEMVARAIFASKIPLISAVGHETDFTIADFVADIRAPTPSAAAELLSPDREEILAAFEGHEVLLEDALWRKMDASQQKLEHLRARLRHPGDKINGWAQQLDGLEIRLTRAVKSELHEQQQQLQQLKLRQSRFHPQEKLHDLQQQLKYLQQRLQHETDINLQQQRQRLAKACELLDSVSPLNTLKRGYAMVTDKAGNIVYDAANVSCGDSVSTQLASGKIICKVEKIA
jgi:exodeoxyribonuclease VII large subunit|tara:strand:+ start:2796 stop:4142 length:1347 start_codon:yes stop_codon:yes gene_type:complete